MARKKKQEDGGLTGDEWLGTYSDCVTLLLTFFILLYSMSTVDAAKVQAISEAFSMMTGREADSILEFQQYDGNQPVIGGETKYEDLGEESSENEVQSKMYDKVKEYLEKNDRKLSEHLQELQFQQQYAKELATNKSFQKEKEIIQAVQNKGMKTITVTYRIAETELTFKLNNVIGSNNEYLFSSQIINKSDRELYDRLTRETIDLQKIKKICYGRKVLYEEEIISA